MNAPVRGARLILFDDRGVRAHMSASWLAQMGWEVLVMEDSVGLAITTGEEPARRVPAPVCNLIEPAALAALPTENLLLVDLALSTRHRKGHVPGARFAMRSRLQSDLPALGADWTVVLLSPDDELARHAAGDLAGHLAAEVLVLAGGTNAWAAAGLPLEKGFDAPLSPNDDVYRRPYEGTDNPREKMQAYLDWEYGLVAQLEQDASHGFYVI